MGAALALAAAGCGSEESPVMSAPGVTTLVLGAVMDQASASAYYSWPSSAKLAIDRSTTV